MWRRAAPGQISGSVRFAGRAALAAAAFGALSLLSPAKAQDADVSASKDPEAARISSGIPAGFEDLIETSDHGAADLEEGALFLAVLEKGRELGNVIARLKDGVLILEAPGEFARLLPELRKAEHLVDSLGRGIDLESPQVCVIGAAAGCKQPNQDDIAFLFDPDRLELEVLRPKTMFAPPDPLAPSHIKDIGAIVSLNTRLSGYQAESGSDIRGSASFRAIAGRGRDSLFANGALTVEEGMQIYEAGAQTYRGTRRYAAGLFRAGASQVALQQDIVGIQIESQPRLRPVTEDAASKPIVVFLARDSYVDVLRGEEILFSDSLAAGSHEISTRRFPAGAYNVTLRIRTEDGATREETRFIFRENGRTEGAAWNVVAGWTRDRNRSYFVEDAREEGQFYTALQFQQSLKGRVHTRNTLGALGDVPFVDTQIDFPLGPAHANTSIRWSPDELGVAARLNGQIEKVSLSAGARYIDATPSGEGAPTGGFLGEQRQYDVSLSRPLPWVGGSANLYARRYERRMAGGDDVSTNIGGGWNRSFDLGPARAVLSLGAQTDGEDSDAYIGLRLSRQEGRRNYTGMVRQQYNGGNAQADANMRYTAQMSQSSALRAATQWRAQLRLNGDDDGVDRIGLGARLSTQAFAADTRVDLKPGDSGRINYAGGFSTALALSPAGVGLSSRTGMQSGVIVTAAKDTPDLSLRANGNAGERHLSGGGVLLPLGTFRDATIRMRPASSDTVIGGLGAVSVLPFPGNVIHVRAEAVQQASVYGRLEGAAGAPLKDVILRAGDVKVKTDEQGFFVADLPTTTEELLVGDAEAPLCRLTIDISGAQSIIDLGDRVCTKPQ